MMMQFVIPGLVGVLCVNLLVLGIAWLGYTLEEDWKRDL